jgi:hypothetical protein
MAKMMLLTWGTYLVSTTVTRAALTLHLAKSVGNSATTAIVSIKYRTDLRSRLGTSGWVMEDGLNPEEDANTFR